MSNWKQETEGHIKNVIDKVEWFQSLLLANVHQHDGSKLENPEAEIFREYTAKLKDSTYGSDEYKQFLTEMKPALDHHYQMNRHHPEHHEDGVDGMDLLDIVEMFFDWWAAGERHADGDIFKSIRHNKKRFNLSGQLANIFHNTALTMKEVFTYLDENGDRVRERGE